MRKSQSRIGHTLADFLGVWHCQGRRCPWSDQVITPQWQVRRREYEACFTETGFCSLSSLMISGSMRHHMNPFSFEALAARKNTSNTSRRCSFRFCHTTYGKSAVVVLHLERIGSGSAALITVLSLTYRRQDVTSLYAGSRSRILSSARYGCTSRSRLQLGISQPRSIAMIDRQSTTTDVEVWSLRTGIEARRGGSSQEPPFSFGTQTGRTWRGHERI